MSSNRTKPFIVVREDRVHLLPSYGFEKSKYGDTYTHYIEREDTYAEGFRLIVNPKVDGKNYPKNTLTINYYFEDNNINSIKYDNWDSDWVVIDSDNTDICNVIVEMWGDGMLEIVKVGEDNSK